MSIQKENRKKFLHLSRCMIGEEVPEIRQKEQLFSLPSPDYA